MSMPSQQQLPQIAFFFFPFFSLCVCFVLLLFFICKISKNKWYHVKAFAKRFRVIGHITGFIPQTQKLEIQPEILSRESTAKEVSFVCSHHRI